jgi:hypothetical protein
LVRAVGWAIGIALVTTSSALALELPDYGLSVQSYFRNRTGFFLDDAHNFRGDKAVLDRFEQSLWFDGKEQFTNNLSATMRLRFFVDNVFDVQNQPGYWSSHDRVYRNLHTSFDIPYDDFLRELYVDYNAPVPEEYGTIFARVGRQQVVWGKADGFRLLDIINPFDFREPFYPTFEDVRIPLWMTRLDYQLPRNLLNNAGLQFIWSPVYENDTFPPAVDSPWSFRAFDTFQAAVDHLHIPVRPNLFDRAKPPALRLENSEAGVRWSHWIKNFGYTLNYYWDWTNLPHARPELVPKTFDAPLGIAYINKPDRVHRFGASFDYNIYEVPIVHIPNVVIRGEWLYSKNNVFYGNLRPDGSAHYFRDSVDYVLGIDKIFFGIPWIAPRWNAQTLVSFQLYQSFLVGYTDGVKAREGLTNPGGAHLNSVKNSFTFFLQNTSLQSRLTSELLAFYSDAGEWWFRPRFIYDVSDRIKAEVGAQLFYGHTNDLVGEFAQKGMQELFIDLRYQFL